MLIKLSLATLYYAIIWPLLATFPGNEIFALVISKEFQLLSLKKSENPI